MKTYPVACSGGSASRVSFGNYISIVDDDLGKRINASRAASWMA